MGTERKGIFEILIGVLLLGALGGIGALLWSKNSEVNFVIEGIPPVTIYNHMGNNAYIVNDLSAAIVSVMQYYGEDLSVNDYKEINSLFFDPKDAGKPHDLGEMRAYFEGRGYTTRIEVPQSIDDFKKYLNPQTKTPVIFSHWMEVGQNPSVAFKPFGILIGILDREQSVIVHDYYFGYSKKLSYREFGGLGAFPAQVLVVEPKKTNFVPPLLDSGYVRTPSMDRVEPVINKITLARVANHDKLPAVAFQYYREAAESPDFESLVPPYYQVVGLSGLANGYRRIEKNLGRALQIAKESEALNHDLDEPFGDFWPGFEDRTNNIINRYSGPYYTLGLIYEAQKDYDAALASYKKAVEIFADSPAKQAMNKLKVRLAK
ncbi:MAG: hypothetical protein AAB804_00870 [Patescibacteria group bacterium]